MLLGSDAYDACIGYFADNLNLFETNTGLSSKLLVSDIVEWQVVDLLQVFCSQQVNLSAQHRLDVISDGDQFIDHLEQVLGRAWGCIATEPQVEFIIEYFLLIKNSLDSEAAMLNAIQSQENVG
ncbi:topoisomerase II [Psychromonas sp. PRT-SC03]|nr:topoisomerase II [Psychromonas sp. PRT-SC03]